MSVDTITIARTVREIEALRPAWARLGSTNIDAEVDYFLAVLENASGDVGPYVVHVKDSGGHELMAVARLERISLPIKLGYTTLGSVAFRAIVLSFDGMLGIRGPTDELTLLDCLAAALGREEADILVMRGLNTEGSLLTGVNRSTRWICRLQGQSTTPRWTADVSMPAVNFLDGRSAKTRQRLKSQQRKLEREYAGRLTVERFEQPDQAETLFRDMSIVAARSYQAGLGAAFSNSNFDRGLVQRALERGWHRSWMLYLDRKPVAFWTGTAYAGVFAIGTPGFDPDYAKQSVGRYTMLRMIDDLCDDPEIQTLDFGGGDADYKSAFGECCRYDRDVVIFAARPRPLACNLLLSTMAATNSLGRAAVRKSIWLTSLKKLWRGGFSRGQSVAAAEPNAVVESGELR